MLLLQQLDYGDKLMLEFKTLEELIEAEAPKVVFYEMEAMMEKVKQELEGDVDIFKLEFMGYLGGNVFLLEELEDLSAIELVDSNLLLHASQFDMAFILKDLSYVVIVDISSDTGGATYFIPNSIYFRSSTVLLSVLLSNFDKNTSSFINSLDVNN